MTPIASALVGVLLGVAYAAVALAMARRAVTGDPSAALRIVLGGMLLRMVGFLALIALVLVLVEVHRGAFVLGLGLSFVLGLVAEVMLVLRHPAGASPAPTADATPTR